LEHLPGLERPCAGRWLTSRGHKDVHHYRLRLDHLEVDDMRFSTYGVHREMHPFQFLCTYSGWLMCGKERVYRHLPERVKRQFSFVQDVPRHPSSIVQVPTQLLTIVLLDTQAWFYLDWEHGCERAWHHEPGYMAWYAKVSHPRIFPPDGGSLRRPANVEHIIEEEHAREMPYTLAIILY